MQPTSADPLAIKIVMIKDEAMRRGLYLTAQKLELAMKEVGWEICELYTKEWKSLVVQFITSHPSAIRKLIKESLSKQEFYWAPNTKIWHKLEKWEGAHWRWYLLHHDPEKRLKKKIKVRRLN